ncbi:MAG: hypothetical protein Q9165_005029 [Trypethelium subeluteriae]
MASGDAFKPALLIIDAQNDFCPPDGSMGIPQGRSIAPVVNKLLDLPFFLRVATKDWHPRDHISFASNHSAPNNKPFESYATIANPLNAAEKQTTRLWPDHCIQDTPGADIIAEIEQGKLDMVVEKGQDPRVEMYSVFGDPFRNPQVARSGLAETLRINGVTDCYVCGLATDYCVKSSVLDAASEGFKVWVIKDGVRGIDTQGCEEAFAEMEKAGAEVIQSDGTEIERVKHWKT